MKTIRKRASHGTLLIDSLPAGVLCSPIQARKRLPKWIKVKLPSNTGNYKNLLQMLKEEELTTVCREAKCPNIYNCFSEGTLTFMILGNICTRDCSYCNIRCGRPLSPDRNEPKKIARMIKRLKLKYIVITCVTRDDLDDGGAGLFVETVKEIREAMPECKVELLISDLKGDWDALKKIVDAQPEVIGHNIEVVRELFPRVRPQGDYERSITLIKNLKRCNPNLITKSGIMVGLGETPEQIIATMKDVADTGCNIITIGQYLTPDLKHASVEKFYTPEEFVSFKERGISLGFDCVESGPLVRSSYKARDSYQKVGG